MNQRFRGIKLARKWKLKDTWAYQKYLRNVCHVLTGIQLPDWKLAILYEMRVISIEDNKGTKTRRH